MWYTKSQPAYLRMDEWDIYWWGNLFRNCEVKIQPLLNLINTTLQGLYGDQEELMEGGQVFGLKGYNNLRTSVRWYNKDTKDDHIPSLLGMDQKLADDSNKPSDKSNTSNWESTKRDPDYIRNLPPWMLEDPKGEVKKNQVWKVILVVQGTPLWKKPVGTLQ